MILNSKQIPSLIEFQFRNGAVILLDMWILEGQNVFCYEHKAQNTLKIPAKFPGVADCKEKGSLHN